MHKLLKLCRVFYPRVSAQLFGAWNRLHGVSTQLCRASTTLELMKVRLVISQRGLKFVNISKLFLKIRSIIMLICGPLPLLSHILQM